MSEQRNAKMDREIIAAATAGPWEASFGVVRAINHIGLYRITTDVGLMDSKFIAESRQALPHWLERAVSAEQRVAELTELLEKLSKQLSWGSYQASVEYAITQIEEALNRVRG